MAVTIAMKPRIDGMLAAVEAPSSQRVPPRMTRLVVSPVRMTAIAPKAGPNNMTRWWPSRSDRTPKIGDRMSSARKNVAEKRPTTIGSTSGPPCCGRVAR